MEREGIGLVAGARIDFGHDRIVPGDDAVGMAGETLRDFPALEHVAEIVDDRKRTAAVHVAVVMRGVRRQHHRTARGLDPHHLQAVGMPADPMQRHARRAPAARPEAPPPRCSAPPAATSPSPLWKVTRSLKTWRTIIVTCSTENGCRN